MRYLQWGWATIDLGQMELHLRDGFAPARDLAPTQQQHKPRPFAHRKAATPGPAARGEVALELAQRPGVRERKCHRGCFKPTWALVSQGAPLSISDRSPRSASVFPPLMRGPEP